MEVTYTIVYHNEVLRKDIPHLPSSIKSRIQQAIEKKLMINPLLFGKPLQHTLKGYRSLRVSDYRIIFRIETKQDLIKIFFIGHRSAIYAKANLTNRKHL